jgi:GTPase involved in cell partitioning and DNA repair
MYLKRRVKHFFQPQYFVDMRTVRAIGGKGGDGAISFLQLWSNEMAGPDGGDGGNGGHVLFQVSDIPSLASHKQSKHYHISSVDHIRTYTIY